MLTRYFQLAKHQTTIRTELLAGVTTFLAMSYIIFAQPAILSGSMFGFDTGMDSGALTTTVCITSAIGCALMALLANYPIAQAPGMGCNFFFVLTLIPAAAATGSETPWATALGVVFLSGILFVLITLLGLRKIVLESVSTPMKNAIAVGIGLFIAFIGLKNTSLIVADPGTFVKLNHQLYNPDIVVFLVGLLVSIALLARRVKGAILFGIVAALILAVIIKLTVPADAPWIAQSMIATQFQLADSVVSLPPSPMPITGKMDLLGALNLTLVPLIIIFLFMDIFDTMGTLIGVTQEAGLADENQPLPRVNRAFLADSVATLTGAALGQSTVTSYIESISGIEDGGRTGLTALTTGALFLLALFFSPIFAMAGNYPAIISPALLIVGAMMIRGIKRLDFQDPSELIPCFLIMLGIPLSMSISDGIAIGFIVYPPAKLLAGRVKQTTVVNWIIAVLFVGYFLLRR